MIYLRFPWPFSFSKCYIPSKLHPHSCTAASVLLSNAEVACGSCRKPHSWSPPKGWNFEKVRKICWDQWPVMDIAMAGDRTLRDNWRALRHSWTTSPQEAAWSNSYGGWVPRCDFAKLQDHTQYQTWKLRSSSWQLHPKLDRIRVPKKKIDMRVFHQW